MMKDALKEELTNKLLAAAAGENGVITRKQAAVIFHDYLRDTIGEKDLDNIEPAAVLRDLYDCRVCVNPIAQMYLKGIIEAFLYPDLGNGNEFLVFEGNREMEQEEMLQCIDRLFEKEKRIKR